MNVEKRSAKTLNNQIERPRDLGLWWQCVAVVFVGILFIGGFGWAARRHFAAVEVSAQNAEMQRERERLRVERQKLLSERETVLSPAELEKKALKIGLQTPTATHLGSSLITNAEIVKPAEEKTKAVNSNEKKPNR